MAKRVQNTKKTAPSITITDTASTFEWNLFLLLAIPTFLMLFASTEKIMDTTLITKYLGFTGFLWGASAWIWISSQKIDMVSLIKENGFLWAYGAFILVTSVSLFQSKVIGDGFISWSKMPLSMIFVCLITAYYIHKEGVRQNISFIIGIFTLISGVVAFFQFIKIIQDSTLSHESSYLIKGLFSHKNILGEILLLCLPFNLFGIFYSPNQNKKYLSILATIVCLAFCIGLFSRAIWLALVFSGLISFLFYIWTEKNISQKTVFKYMGMGILFLVVSFVLLGFVVSFEVLQKRFNSITNIQDFANQERLLQWKNTLTLFYEKPFFGIGMENWKIETLKFPVLKGIRGDSGDYFFQRPHNDYLWILSESGIFAFILWISVLGIAYHYIFKCLQKTDNQEIRTWLYLLFGGLTAYCIFSTFSFPRERMEDIFLLNLIFMGILIEKNTLFSVNSSQNTENTSQNKVFLLPAMLLLGICMYVGYERFEGEKHLKNYHKLLQIANTQSAQNRKNSIQNALREINLAYRPLYKIDPISTPLKYLIGTKHLEMNELELGKKELLEANQLSPYHPQVLNNLAAVYSMKQDNVNALKYIKKAVRLAPKYQDALLSAIALYAMKSDFDSSFLYLTQIDTNSQNPKYLSYNNSIRDSVATHASQSMEEPFLKEKIREIVHTKEWANAILKKANDQNISFSSMLRAEALQMMKKDKNLSEAEWVILRDKYLGKSH